VGLVGWFFSQSWGQHIPDKPVEQQCQELNCAAPEAASIGALLLLLLIDRRPVVQERNQQTAVMISLGGSTFNTLTAEVHVNL